MGVCCTSVKSMPLERVVCGALIKAIERNTESAVSTAITRFYSQEGETKLSINDPVIRLEGEKVSPLSYALLSDCHIAFKELIETGKASVHSLRQELAKKGLSVFDILIPHENIEFLSYYLPLHKSYSEDQEYDLSEDLSLFQTHKPIVPVPEFAYPMHIACETGSVLTVKFFLSYFREHCPPEYDLHSLNPITGENAGLCSIKSGNLRLIRYLYEEHAVNFKISNARKENAVTIAAAWSVKKTDTSFLDVLRYIVEIIRVDFLYEYEETLLILEDPELILYMENKLRDAGIYTKKVTVENKNRLVDGRVPTYKDMIMEERIRNAVKNIKFKDLFREELAQDNISSISVRAGTVFHINSRDD